MELASARQVLERLRTAEPDGRVVMPIHPAAYALPATVLLENNDSINVPVRPSTVGVFGAVYRPASFLLDGDSAAASCKAISRPRGRTVTRRRPEQHLRRPRQWRSAAPLQGRA